LRSRTGLGSYEEFQLQGTRDWGRLFLAAQEYAEVQGLDKLKIDVNAPWIHESYHAVWKSKLTKLTESQDEWSAQFPLILEGRVFGRVEIFSHHNAATAYRCLPELMDLLENEGPRLLQFPQTSSTNVRETATVAAEAARTKDSVAPPSAADLVRGSVLGERPAPVGSGYGRE
jgi:hypothetical protein